MTIIYQFRKASLDGQLFAKDLAMNRTVTDNQQELSMSASCGQPHQIGMPAGSAFLNFRGSVQLRTDSPFCALRCEHCPLRSCRDNDRRANCPTGDRVGVGVRYGGCRSALRGGMDRAGNRPARTALGSSFLARRGRPGDRRLGDIRARYRGCVVAASDYAFLTSEKL